MSRTRATAKQAGSRFERVIADCMAWVLKDDRIDRAIKRGADDRGDIANVRTRDGYRLVIECKDTTRLDIGHWISQATTERDNDNALAGIVVHKRRGKGDPLDQYVTMTLRDLLLIGWGQEAMSEASERVES